MAQQAQYQVPECPTDCANLDNLPATSFETCVEAMKIFESEICDIFITIPDENGNAVNKPAAWTEAAVQTWYNDYVGEEAGDTVRRVVCIADMSSEEAETGLFSKRRKKTIGLKPHLVNVTIDDMSDENREFLRTLECGATVVMWFGTIGGNFFGGVDGILCDIFNVKLPLERGENNYEYGTFQMEWKAAAAPPRITATYG
jgi:NTP pyrophosphatase (non-canonical NTP hydrolase)